jgi:ubiquinone/menaquinone biosynthesis C-methylase UbiE
VRTRRQHHRDVERFNQWSASYDQHWLQGLLLTRIQNRIVDLSRRLPSPPRSIVDIGCGTGQLAARLLAASPDADIMGIDPAPGMLDVARAAVPGADFVDGRAEDLPTATGFADLVVTTMSFHHWHDQHQGVSEVGRVLCEDGTFLLCDPVTRFWTSPFVSLAGARSRIHTTDEVPALLRQAHLNVRESVPVHRTMGVVRIIVASRWSESRGR